jgi:ATP-binding cassette subfamily B protein
VYALYFPLIEFLTTFALASLLVAAGFRVGNDLMTVGTVAAFLQLVRRFFQPLQDLSEKYNILQAAMAASERIFGLLDTPVAAGVQATPDRAAQAEALRGAGVTVEFENVWFAYDREQGLSEDHAPEPAPARPETHERPDDGLPPEEVRWVLKGVSFRVAPVMAIALVGHTGAGKTTVVNLLLRFYEPQRGRILVNGTDIREMPVDVLRSVMAYVQQDIFLFAGDVAGNLRLDAALDDAALATSAARVGVAAALFTEKRLVGSLLGSCWAPRDIPRLVDLWQSGRLDLDGLVTRRRPLEEVEDALDDLEAGRGLRTVLMVS